MAQFKLIDGAGKEISTTLLVKDISTQAIFDAVIAENAGQRQGTHSTLTKAEVRGGGKKPRPQKHSGRARQGSTRSPQ
jgi:large subunit ribosomal protein L4